MNTVKQYQPKSFDTPFLKNLGNQTFFRLEIPESLLWKNYHLSGDHFFKILNQNSPFPTFFVSEILINQSNNDLDCLLGETIEDLKKRLIKTMTQQFKAYLEALKKDLQSHISEKDLFRRLNYKFINKNRIDERVSDLKNKIEIVNYFISHRLEDSIHFDITNDLSFVLPNCISNIIETQTFYCVDLKGKYFNLGLNKLNINHLSYRYQFLDHKKEQEADVILTVKTKKEREFKDIYITKKNREQYIITSHEEGLFYFLEQQHAIDFVEKFINELRKSIQ